MTDQNATEITKLSLSYAPASTGLCGDSVAIKDETYVSAANFRMMARNAANLAWVTWQSTSTPDWAGVLAGEAILAGTVVIIDG